MEGEVSEILRARIALARKAKGWGVAHLASQLGVTAQTVRDWEAGRTVPDLRRLDSIALVFQRPPSWFLLDWNAEMSVLSSIADEIVDAASRLKSRIPTREPGAGLPEADGFQAAKKKKATSNKKGSSSKD